MPDLTFGAQVIIAEVGAVTTILLGVVRRVIVKTFDRIDKRFDELQEVKNREHKAIHSHLERQDKSMSRIMALGSSSLALVIGYLASRFDKRNRKIS